LKLWPVCLADMSVKCQWSKLVRVTVSHKTKPPPSYSHDHPTLYISVTMSPSRTEFRAATASSFEFIWSRLDYSSSCSDDRLPLGCRRLRSAGEQCSHAIRSSPRFSRASLSTIHLQLRRLACCAVAAGLLYQQLDQQGLSISTFELVTVRSKRRGELASS